MTTSLRRRREPRPTIVLQYTNHWRIVDGVHYRDCLVELPDGTRRIMAVLDSLLGVAA